MFVLHKTPVRNWKDKQQMGENILFSQFIFFREYGGIQKQINNKISNRD